MQLAPRARRAVRRPNLAPLSMPRRSSPPPPAPPPVGGVPCVILDPKAVRLHTGTVGGSYDFSARVPNWQLGARIKMWLRLPGTLSPEPAVWHCALPRPQIPGRQLLTPPATTAGNNSLHHDDAQSAACESWCDPDTKGPDKRPLHTQAQVATGWVEHCGWCKCAGCATCARTSGLRLGQSCTVPGQVTSCWGATVIEHEFLGEATVRLGAPSSDKDFGCNVAMPQGRTAGS